MRIIPRTLSALLMLAVLQPSGYAAIVVHAYDVKRTPDYVTADVNIDLNTVTMTGVVSRWYIENNGEVDWARGVNFIRTGTDPKSIMWDTYSYLPPTVATASTNIHAHGAVLRLVCAGGRDKGYRIDRILPDIVVATPASQSSGDLLSQSSDNKFCNDGPVEATLRLESASFSGGTLSIPGQPLLPTYERKPPYALMGKLPMDLYVNRNGITEKVKRTLVQEFRVPGTNDLMYHGLGFWAGVYNRKGVGDAGGEVNYQVPVTATALPASNAAGRQPLEISVGVLNHYERCAVRLANTSMSPGREEYVSVMYNAAPGQTYEMTFLLDFSIKCETPGSRVYNITVSHRHA
ncbi:hypothetical protein DTR82_17655 [Salmonella enterica subsp. enterica serovar Javiana]|nr:hypothetical protein [Salmonella enterica subsp. enterica serovar Javiana]